MRVLAEFIMRGRMQACLVGVFGSLLPFVSVSTIGLVTLRKGAVEGFIVSLWVILPILLSYMFSASSPIMAVVSGVALINMAVVANAHRVTADWNFSLGVATLSGIVLVCLTGLLFQADVNDFVNELEEMLATASEQAGQTILVLTRNGFLAFVAWVVIFNTLIGGLSLSFIGKKVLSFINDLLKKIPILRTIYSAIGQMTETFTDRKKSKKSVVLVEYPRKGTWAVGFATKDNKGEITKKTNKKLVNVFVPTTPNPTSGFLLMFPKDEIIFLDMSFEEASKFIVSAGTSNPKN